MYTEVPGLSVKRECSLFLLYFLVSLYLFCICVFLRRSYLCPVCKILPERVTGYKLLVLFGSNLLSKQTTRRISRAPFVIARFLVSRISLHVSI